MKIDLNWGYHYVDWEFLTMILYKIIFLHRHVQWIMACILTTSMVVLINGEPTKFFKVHRGLREGCTLSPLLFILVMNTFNRGINAMKELALSQAVGSLEITICPT